jgi:hypothetical protein
MLNSCRGCVLEEMVVDHFNFINVYLQKSFERRQENIGMPMAAKLNSSLSAIITDSHTGFIG